MIAGAGWLMSRQPIKTVEILNLNHIELAEPIFEHVMPFIESGFFGAKLKKMQSEIELIPWVRQAALRRQWPNQLSIEVFEHIPLAQWGLGGIITRSGEWIATDEMPLPVRMIGPQGAEKRMALLYHQMNHQLSGVGLQIQSIKLTPRGAWTVVLDNQIRFGAGNRRYHETLTTICSSVGP